MDCSYGRGGMVCTEEPGTSIQVTFPEEVFIPEETIQLVQPLNQSSMQGSVQASESFGYEEVSQQAQFIDPMQSSIQVQTQVSVQGVDAQAQAQANGGRELVMTEALAKDIMSWGSLKYSQDEIEEARNFLYPYQTEEGLLVSVQAVETGNYRVEDEEAGIAVDTGIIPISSEEYVEVRQMVTVPPKPVYQTPNFYPYEDCGNPLTAQACTERNITRQSANFILKANADALYNRAVCERNGALNINAGHPEFAKDCESEFPLQLVPDLGVMLAPGVDIGSGIYPAADVPAYIPYEQAAPVYTDYSNPSQPASNPGNTSQVTTSDLIAGGSNNQGGTGQFTEILGGEIDLGGFKIPLWGILAGVLGIVLIARR